MKNITPFVNPKFLCRPPKVSELDSLPDVVVDGVCQLKVGDRCVLYRDYRRDRALGVCQIMILDDDGGIYMIDHTMGQWVTGNIKRPAKYLKIF